MTGAVAVAARLRFGRADHGDCDLQPFAGRQAQRRDARPRGNGVMSVGSSFTH